MTLQIVFLHCDLSVYDRHVGMEQIPHGGHGTYLNGTADFV